MGPNAYGPRVGASQEKGCPTALITGEAGSGEGRADAVFRTVAQERSPAHTVSSHSRRLLALLAGRVGYQTGSATLPYELLREELPEVLRTALVQKKKWLPAREHVGRRRSGSSAGGRAR